MSSIQPALNAYGMPLPGSCALLVVLWVTGASSAFGQSQTTSRPLETLEEEFTDPLTTLPQIFLKDAYSPTNYGTNVQTILCFRAMDGLSPKFANHIQMEC